MSLASLATRSSSVELSASPEKRSPTPRWVAAPEPAPRQPGRCSEPNPVAWKRPVLARVYPRAVLHRHPRNSIQANAGHTPGLPCETPLSGAARQCRRRQQKARNNTGFLFCGGTARLSHSIIECNKNTFVFSYLSITEYHNATKNTMPSAFIRLLPTTTSVHDAGHPRHFPPNAWRATHPELRQGSRPRRIADLHRIAEAESIL